jgi:excisionase family DNA binding protein
MLLAPDGRTLLSTIEAHERSGLSQDHIGLLVRRGAIEATKVGNYWLIYEDSLQRYLESPRKPGPKPNKRGAAVTDSTMPV